MGAAIGAGASLIGGLVGQQGANRAAEGAQNAALAQQAEARRQYDQISGIANRATASSLNQFDQAIQAQERNLSRQEQLVSQIDPTIIEASRQALKLLRGEQSSTLAPMQQQRDRQRQQLVNTLREQLGPGAETSTAGIQALTRFDQETSGLLSGAQQQALSNLGQTFGVFSQNAPNILGQAQGLAGLGQGRAGLQFDQARLLQQAGNPLIQSAGAQFSGDVLRGQGQANFGNALMGFGFQQLGQHFATPASQPGAQSPTQQAQALPSLSYNFGANRFGIGAPKPSYQFYGGGS